jgi:sterol desaturase/sphingolipid hydroxylase (fatty acid hydroxylase superfamily)
MENILTLCLLAAYALLLVLDVLAPARTFGAVRFWRLKGFAFFLVSVTLFVSLPFVWDPWLSQYRLLDLRGLGTWGGALVGLLTMQFVSYWWHRTMHNTPLLWRAFHQLHHSAERVDIWGAFYFHPLDVVGFAFAGSLGLALLVGVTPEAAVIAGSAGTFCAFFQHANIRTPRWLGYFIQRPENHTLHHERGVHAFNYGDIALWDIVFGTFKNPATFTGECGFYDGASARVAEALIGRDVSEPAPARAAAPARELPQQLGY